ncbi:hypothetical protein B0H14DRAFT_2565927 [Mycena olivaceomarginata]|nr:hypothetical protein B0H14DRAFT_2565927 [Mycena olivaceomarginata]
MTAADVQPNRAKPKDEGPGGVEIWGKGESGRSCNHLNARGLNRGNGNSTTRARFDFVIPDPETRSVWDLDVGEHNTTTGDVEANADGGLGQCVYYGIVGILVAGSASHGRWLKHHITTRTALENSGSGSGQIGGFFCFGEASTAPDATRRDSNHARTGALRSIVFSGSGGNLRDVEAIGERKFPRTRRDALTRRRSCIGTVWSNGKGLDLNFNILSRRDVGAVGHPRVIDPVWKEGWMDVDASDAWMFGCNFENQIQESEESSHVGIRITTPSSPDERTDVRVIKDASAPFGRPERVGVDAISRVLVELPVQKSRRRGRVDIVGNEPGI